MKKALTVTMLTTIWMTSRSLNANATMTIVVNSAPIGLGFASTNSSCCCITHVHNVHFIIIAGKLQQIINGY